MLVSLDEANGHSIIIKYIYIRSACSPSRLLEVVGQKQVNSENRVPHHYWWWLDIVNENSAEIERYLSKNKSSAITS